jgi:hypothetical protein
MYSVCINLSCSLSMLLFHLLTIKRAHGHAQITSKVHSQVLAYASRRGLHIGIPGVTMCSTSAQFQSPHKRVITQIDQKRVMIYGRSSMPYCVIVCRTWHLPFLFWFAFSLPTLHQWTGASAQYLKCSAGHTAADGCMPACGLRMTHSWFRAHSLDVGSSNLCAVLCSFGSKKVTFGISIWVQKGDI